MDARERLRAGRTATHQGRHSEALEHFLWFHDHALEEDGSYSGVRLSFALGYWLELAAVHPPALDAFRDRRDTALAMLRAGQLSRGLFHDVEAMSEKLGEDDLVADLFMRLHATDRTFADACSNIALPLLVRTKRFALARQYMPDPISRVQSLAQDLLRDVDEIDTRPRKKAPRFHAFTHIFAEDLRDVLAIIRATESCEQASKIEREAIALLRPKYVREAVLKRLASDA